MSGPPNDLMMPGHCYRYGQSDCVNNGSSERKPPALMAPCRPRGSQPILPLYDEEELPLALEDAVTSSRQNLVASRRSRHETRRTLKTQTPPDTQAPEKPLRTPPTSPTQPTQPPPPTPKLSPVPPGVIVIKPRRHPTPLIKIHPVHALSPTPTAADGSIPHLPNLTRCPVGRAKTTVKVGKTTSLLIPNPRLRRALDSSSSPVSATQQQLDRRGGGAGAGVEVGCRAGSPTKVVREEALPGDLRGQDRLRESRPGLGDTASTEEHGPKTTKKKEKEKRECIGWILRWIGTFVSTPKVANEAQNDTNAASEDDGRVYGRNLDGSGRSHDTGDDDVRDVRGRDNQVLVDFLREGLSDVDSDSE
ncbi:hypothetical protein GE09DRAFT_1057755 [Coniochaeta sp. 2T2.1]|nr:hypothetical protein GE09DRAFT_1057755 [Coniochaeta sp. 2T2.1]